MLKYSKGETFPGYKEDDNGGLISTAGINVGKWGNRIEVYGKAELCSSNFIAESVKDAEELRDVILAALQRSCAKCTD